jgi:hypothetical protein
MGMDFFGGGPGRLALSYQLSAFSLDMRAVENLFFCHPERSEGSELAANARFFAALRMTI